MTSLFSKGSVELASMIGSAWLQRSLIAPSVETLNAVELSERKRSARPRFPLGSDSTFADAETIECESHLSKRRCDFGVVASARLGLGRDDVEEEEEESCDDDAAAAAVADADAVHCCCSGTAAVGAISARAAAVLKKKRTAALSSAIHRRRMAKERSLFPLSRLRSVFPEVGIQLPFLCSSLLLLFVLVFSSCFFLAFLQLGKVEKQDSIFTARQKNSSLLPLSRPRSQQPRRPPSAPSSAPSAPASRPPPSPRPSRPRAPFRRRRRRRRIPRSRRGRGASPTAGRPFPGGGRRLVSREGGVFFVFLVLFLKKEEVRERRGKEGGTTKKTRNIQLKKTYPAAPAPRPSSARTGAPPNPSSPGPEGTRPGPSPRRERATSRRARSRRARRRTTRAGPARGC